MATPIHPFTAWLLVASMLAAVGLSEPQSDGLDSSASKRPTTEIRHPENEEMLVLFPHSYAKHPHLPSPQMARPLFHVWNAILLELEHGARQGRALRFYRAFSPIEYNGSKVFVKAEGTKGFQQSLFNDEIRGTAIITIARELTPSEADFLQEKYAHLSTQQKDELIARLTRMQTGEMEPYYVMRYGFYEGHTPWRVDPIAIAFIFGLRSLDEIEAAFPGNLYESLTGHFVACPRPRDDCESP